MEVKLCFCVLVFIFSQFFFLKDAAAASRPIGSYFKLSYGWSHDSKRCKNDSDCDSIMVCYTDKCHQCDFHGTQKTVGVCRKARVSVEKCPTSEHIVCQDHVTCALKCNTIRECEDGEDEKGCPECPEPVLMFDCKDVLEHFPNSSSGIYTIMTKNTHTHLEVYCDMVTDGGGWTVFQHRVNGSLNFNKTFEAYENGFGDPGSEFWLGLKHIQDMTSDQQSQLRFALTDVNNEVTFRQYENFYLSHGKDYRLQIRNGSGDALSITFRFKELVHDYLWYGIYVKNQLLEMTTVCLYVDGREFKVCPL